MSDFLRKCSTNEVTVNPHGLIATIDKAAFENEDQCTAYTIALIQSINYTGVEYTLPNTDQRKLSNRLLNRLDAIRYGKVEDLYGWNYTITNL